MSLGIIQEEDTSSSLNKAISTTLLPAGNDDCRRVIIRYASLDEEDMSNFIGTVLNPNIFWSSNSYMEKNDGDEEEEDDERILVLISAKPSARDSLKRAIRRSKKSITLIETDYQPK